MRGWKCGVLSRSRACLASGCDLWWGGPKEGMGGARHASKAPDGYTCLGHPPRGPTRPLTKPQNRVQGHVLPDVSQGGHRQLVCQVQGRSEIEAVTWGGEGGTAGERQPLGHGTRGEGSRQGWQSALGMATARGTAPRSRPGAGTGGRSHQCSLSKALSRSSLEGLR